MKTSLVLAAIASMTASSLAIGCGCDPGNNSLRKPVELTPSSAAAIRTPFLCDKVDPMFTTSDAFSLQLANDSGTKIRVDLTSPVVLGQSIPLGVGQPSQDVTTAKSSDGAVQFSYTGGSNPDDLYDLNAVVVTVTGMPTAEGQPLSAELYLTFGDGRVLDQVYSAPLHTNVVSCAANAVIAQP